MQKQQAIKILLLLALTAALCGVCSAVSVGAEPHITSGAEAPVCTAPCECISETAAVQRWGADGWERCSKTVCGQSADAMVQYYCIHQSGSSVAAGSTPAGGAPAAPAAATPQKSSGSFVVVIASLGCALLGASIMKRR